MPELNSIYYVTSALANSQLRNKPCSACSDILLSNTSTVETAYINVFDCKLDDISQFMKELNQGRFIFPNNISFPLCQHCYCTFN